MPEKAAIEKIIGRVVSEVLEHHIADLRDEVVSRVREQLPQVSAAADGASDLEPLLKAVSAIHAASTQRDVLRALLENALSYCGRAALFVVKSGAVTGWQGRGFGSNDAVKDFSLDPAAPAVRGTLESRKAAAARAGDMDRNFLATLGSPSDGRCLVLPLLLKDKVAALVYADAGIGSGGTLNVAALQILVMTTGSWLEVASLRKSPPASSSESTAPTPRAAAAAPALNDPFAAHAPAHAAAAAAGSASIVDQGAGAKPAAGATAPSEPDAFAGLPPEEADIHRKAQRFARLLVDEIKLYNHAKVMEGRKKQDLYDQLKEDIDKSRSTYHKRYGNTVAAAADYFNQEVVRSLAGDDVSLMGRNFRG